MKNQNFFDDNRFALEDEIRRMRAFERESKPDYMVFSTPGRQPSGLANDIMDLVAMMTQKAAPAAKTYEIGNRLVQMDASGKPVEIYAAPTIPKNEELELRKKALSARIIGLERDRSNPDVAREFKLQGTTVDEQLKNSWAEAAMLLAAPVKPQPIIDAEIPVNRAFGTNMVADPFVNRAFGTNLPPSFNPLQSTNSAVVPSAPKKWVRDSSGKMVEAK